MSKTLLTQNFQEWLHAYISNPCFTDAISLTPANPYQRPLRSKDAMKLDFDKTISLADLNSNKNLIINKILLNIYEQDLLFLDHHYQATETKKNFKQFYDSHFVAIGKAILPMLENLAFHFLHEEVEVIGHWDKAKLLDYLTSVINDQEKESSELCSVMLHSINPERAAKMLLIQMAPDFLSEASAMARALPGSFGVEQSELMKVFIDEYGYGVHAVKHSTLFEKTLISANLNPAIHFYYNDYLPTSLMLVNYFHYICRNKAEWFKYIGMLYYTEASIPHFNLQVSSTIKKILPSTNTKYFDEHVHIDKHHRRMVLDKIIATSIDKYGEEIIDDILFGFEAFRLLQNLADADLIKQIQFTDQLQQKTFPHEYRTLHQEQIFNETKGEITTAHLHSENELFQVINGELTFYANSLAAFNLKNNDKIIIPKGRLHATVAESMHTQYFAQPIEFV